MLDTVKDLTGPTSSFAGLMPAFRFRRVECIRDYQRKLCQVLGYTHYLKPARIQIIASGLIYNETFNVSSKKAEELLVYKFSSPIYKEYIKKKVLMFSIAKPVLEIEGGIETIRGFDDVKTQQNVIFALESSEP